MRKVQRSIISAMMIRRFVTILSGWLFIWGTITLILRITTDIDSTILLSGAAGIPLALFAAYIIARRNIPGTDRIRAKIDAINRDGGMLMASAEADMPEWAEQIIIDCLPAAHWQDRRYTVAFVAGCLFAAAAFIIPIPQSVLIGSNSLDVNELVEELQAKVDLIEEEELIDEERADELQENLNKISDEAAGDDPVKTWEALDHIDDTLQDIAAEAAEELQKTVSDTAAMDALANAMQESLTKNGASPELNTAMQEMAALLEAKNLLNKMEGAIPSDLAQALKDAKLTPEQLKKLSEALKKCQCQSIDKMAKLCKASMIDPNMLSKCKSCACDSEQALKDFMDSECKDGKCMALATMVCNMPGNGGISRGRGDAPMTWTDGTDENGAGFKEETIEPDAIAGIDKSRMVGISKGAPQVNDKPTITEGGALTGAAAGGGNAHKQRVLPQHKQAVMRYFHRE